AFRTSRSQKPQVSDRAAGHGAHVKVGEAYREQAHPGKEHVPLVQKRQSAPEGAADLAEGRAREAVEISAREVPQGMARERVERKQDDVGGQHERAETHAEASIKREGADGVDAQKNDEEDSNIEEVAVDVLEDERKLRLAAVGMPTFSDGARRRVEEEGPIVGLSVVVAGHPKAQRS